MSFVARSSRTVARIIPKNRPYSIVVDAPSSEWVAKREAIKHHAAGKLDIILLALKVRLTLSDRRYHCPLAQDQVRDIWGSQPSG